MKKEILLFVILVISLPGIAQLPATFGVKAGVTYSGISGKATNNLENFVELTNGMVTTSNRTGLFIGGYTNLPIDEIVSVEPGIYFSQKGYALKGELNIKSLDFLGAAATAHLNTQYIDVPVLLKVNVTGLQLFAGPQVSYLTNADLKTTAGVLGFNLLNKTIDATDQFSRWDVGITGGIGYQFSNGFNVMASYDYGLSKLDANHNMNSYNRSFKVGAGFTF